MKKNNFLSLLVFCLVSTTALSPFCAAAPINQSSQEKKVSDSNGKEEVLTKEEVNEGGIPSSSREFEVPQRAKPVATAIKKAKTPTVAIKGAAAFNLYTGSQSNKTTVSYDAGNVNNVSEAKTRGGSHMFGFDDTRLEFEIRQRLDFLWFFQWKINVSLGADKSASTPNLVKQAYITLNSKYSTIELGNYAGMEDRMAFSGVSILGGTGGFDGNSQKFALPTTGTHTNVDLIGDSGEATKINLLSARWKGIMIGVSYTPSTAHFGGASLNSYGSPSYGSNVGKPYYVNNVAAGLNYVGFLTPDLKLSASLTGVIAKSKPEVSVPAAGQSLDRHNAKSYAIGAVLSYKNFSFGGEYADCRKSMQFSKDRAGVNPQGISGDLVPLDYKASEATAPKFFDLGVAYIYDQTKFAIGYLQSWRKTGFDGMKATARVWNASITQQVAAGLSVYLEGFHYNTKNNAADYEAKLQAQSLPNSKGPVSCIGNQKAKVIILGMKASF